MVIPTQTPGERVIGYSKSPVNEGKLCLKGYSGLSYNFSKERLKYPLIKRNGEFVRVSWEAALTETSNRLKKIIKVPSDSSFST